MRRYFIKSLGSLIHLLIAQGILAVNLAFTTDNQLAHLNVNLASLRETPRPGQISVTFDLNEHPPNGPKIVSLSSTSPTTSSEHTLSLPREHLEENLVLSTAESIPYQHSSPSSLKRKEETSPYVDQMRNIRQKLSGHYGHVAHKNGVGFPDDFTALHSKAPVTSKKPAGLLKYKRPSQDQNVRGLLPVHQGEQPLRVDNWDYVKLNLKIEGISDHIHAGYGEPEMTEKNFFDYMHDTYSFLPRGETFWIPKSRIGEFRERHREVRKTGFKYPKEVPVGTRQAGTKEIMLKIAENKLHVDSCWSASGDIKTQLKQSINANNPRSRFIRKLTKLSVTLSVLCMTIFGEHEGPTLSQSYVSSMVPFIQDAITPHAEMPVPAGVPESEVAEKRRQILNDFKFKSKKSNRNAAEEMNLAWKIVEYWRTMTRKSSQTSLTDAKTEVQEVINKIIFYSNHKYFTHKALANEIKEAQKKVPKAT